MSRPYPQPRGNGSGKSAEQPQLPYGAFVVINAIHQYQLHGLLKPTTFACLSLLNNLAIHPGGHTSLSWRTPLLRPERPALNHLQMAQAELLAIGLLTRTAKRGVYQLPTVEQIRKVAKRLHSEFRSNSESRTKLRNLESKRLRNSEESSLRNSEESSLRNSDGVYIQTSDQTIKQTNTNTPAGVSPADLTDAQILAIYKAYPKRVAKPAALRAIRKAVKTVRELQQDDPVYYLLARCNAYAALCLAQDTAPKYIPHPATWFNEERFEDEPLIEFIHALHTGDTNVTEPAAHGKSNDGRKNDRQSREYAEPAAGDLIAGI